MDEIETSMAAFPVADPFAVRTPKTEAEALMLQRGMTLRDYFAAKAMQGIFASGKAEPSNQTHFDNIAEDSYRMADAMIAAREK